MECSNPILQARTDIRANCIDLTAKVPEHELVLALALFRVLTPEGRKSTLDLVEKMKEAQDHAEGGETCE